MTPTIQDCFEELRPTLNEIARLAKIAPLPDNERAGLCILIAGHFFGTAQAAMGKVRPTEAREVADLIVETIGTTIQRPVLVHSAGDAP